MPKTMSQRLCERMMERSRSLETVGEFINRPHGTCGAAVAEQVEPGQQHQREACSKNGLVTDAAVRRNARGHLHDQAGDRGGELMGLSVRLGCMPAATTKNHGLAHSTRNTQDVGRCNPRQRRNFTAPRGSLKARGTQGVGAFAQASWERPAWHLPTAKTRTDDHDAHHQSGGEDVERGQLWHRKLCSKRCDHQQRKAVDDGQMPESNSSMGLSTSRVLCPANSDR